MVVRAQSKSPSSSNRPSPLSLRGRHSPRSPRSPTKNDSPNHSGCGGAQWYRRHQSEFHSVVYLLLFIASFEISLRKWDLVVHHQIPHVPLDESSMHMDSLMRKESVGAALALHRTNDTAVAVAPEVSKNVEQSGTRSHHDAPKEQPINEHTPNEQTSNEQTSNEQTSNEQTSNEQSSNELPTIDSTESATTDSEPITTSAIVDPVVLTWDGYDAMNHLVSTYYGNDHVVCDAIQEQRTIHNNPQLPILVNITFGCADLFRMSGFGSGNFISLFYGLRLMAHVHTHVGLSISCHDAKATQSELILPWLTGYFPPRNDASTPNPYPMVSQAQSCSSYQLSQTSRMVAEIQDDFRHMAVALVGRPKDPAWATMLDNPIDQSNQRHLHLTRSDPIFYNETLPSLDDTVIHFRCGDLMNSQHEHFAFVKFQTYTQHISPHAQTIGIITQPFATPDGALGQSRWIDRGDVEQDRCRRVVTALVDYIQDRHPSSTIAIRNGPSETTALAYARMIMANQTIAGISTFGVFAAVSTFGTGYLHRPDGPFPNFWMLNPRIDELASNLHLFVDTDFLMVSQMKEMWETHGVDAVLAWFRGDVVATETVGAQ